MKGVVQMKKCLSKFARLAMGVIPALAMMIAIQSVSATCCYILHQPDVPEGMK
jgi:cyclic lactone autoinducer peptide